MAYNLLFLSAFKNNDKMTNMKKYIITAAMICLAVLPAKAQRVLTIEDCRQMAVEQSNELDQARIQIEMADYDKKIARAYYFPKVSATGAYIYQNRDIALVNQDQSDRLRNMGTTVEDKMWADAEGRLTPRGQALLEELRSTGVMPDIATPLNAIGEEIDDSMHPDLHNILVGAVVVEQPIFAGGKIVNSNQMAALAQDLSKSKYDMAEADVLLDVDQAYWQIVSIANKKKLAESYADLLHHMEQDVQTAIAAGVSTESDALQVKVKANEADMMLTKATNGLTLAKMLLCKRIGLPLDTEIVLADEKLEVIPAPEHPAWRSIDDIYAARPETRSLELAEKIFEKKAAIARADMYPTVGAMGVCAVNNPNVYNGFQNVFQGCNLYAGVVVRVPICHGGESIYKYRKAKAEANLYADKLGDAKDLINLQVTQQRKLYDETVQKVTMAESNLESASENLRKATIGYESGVIPTNTVLAAHTAWLSASSEYIDAGIDLQMTAASLRKAEGEYLK